MLDTKEVFVKQTYRSRFDILGPNGKLTLSVPVKKVNGSKTKTEEMEIDNSIDWRNQHLRSIRTAYASAPYFEHYFFDLMQFYAAPYMKLVDLCEASLKAVTDWFDLELQWRLIKDEQQRSEALDFRQNNDQQCNTPPYYQVFFDRFSFVPDLSVVDLVMNEGPMGRNYLI